MLLLWIISNNGYNIVLVKSLQGDQANGGAENLSHVLVIKNWEKQITFIKTS